jgi:Putative phage serine protease XkdF
MDDALAVVAEEIFGGAIDPRELSDFISKQNDQSEMHVNRGLESYNKDRAKKNKRQAQVGLAGNVIGLTAGGAALMAAGKDKRLNNAGRLGAAIQAPYKLTSKTNVGRRWANFASKPKVAGSLALGAVGLQALNTAGDVVGNRVLNREAKKPVDPLITVDTKKDQIHIKKALDDIIDARRRGIINTDTAIQMSSELVEKVAGTLNGDAKTIHEEAKALVPMPTDMPKKMGLKPMAKNKPIKNAVKKPATPNMTPEPIMDKSPGDIIKSDSPDLTWTGTIEKMDTEKRQVFGYCTVTHVNGEAVVDRQGDYVPLDEIEKAAYTYVVQSRKGGDMHARDGEMPLHTSDMIESFIVTPEKLEKMGLDPNAVPHGWWVGFQVNDDKQWDMVKNGERTAFSIHGSGKRVEKSL